MDGEVAIAEVIEDGLRGKETAAPAVRSVERQTVSAGDEVEGVIKKIKKIKKAVPLSKAEKGFNERARADSSIPQTKEKTREISEESDELPVVKSNKKQPWLKKSLRSEEK